MKVADLIANIRREVATDLPDAELMAMLNDEQREIAADLKLPTRTVTVSGITGDFSLPAEAQYNALVSAEATGDWGTFPLAVWTVSEASERYIDWGQNIGTQVGAHAIIYDPTNVTTAVRPVPNPCSSSTLRITYAVKPPDFVTLTDVPFLGEIPEQHHALAYGVIGRLLIRNSDQRASVFFSQRDSLVDAAWRDSRPAPVRTRRSPSPRFGGYRR